jgi:hypothetical protein
LWDTIARLGIETCLKQGLISSNWVSKVFEHADTNPCGKKLKYPRVFYRRAGEANNYMTTLYRLAEARGITEGEIHGSGSMEFNNNDRTYVNSWIVEGVCKACKNEKPMSYGSGRYPYGSILSHVNSVRHARNAIEYLLKKQQKAAIAKVASAHLKKKK